MEKQWNDTEAADLMWLDSNHVLDTMISENHYNHKLKGGELIVSPHEIKYFFSNVSLVFPILVL